MDELSEFLFNNNLINLLGTLNDQGDDLDFLLDANDHELSVLVPAIVLKGKLHLALSRERDTRRIKNTQPNVETVDEFVAAPQKQDSFVVPSSSEVSISTSSPIILPSDVASSSHDILEWEINCDELSYITNVTEAESLKTVLESTSVGKPLLGKQVLSTYDRKILTALIVEAEVQKLSKVTDPIRKETWEKWTAEITKLFAGERDTGVYYSPFRLVDGKIIQAGGLIVNRLITVRRKLNANNRSRSLCSDQSSDSSGSEKKKRKTIAVQSSPARVRPLPDSFNLNTTDTTNKDSENDNIQWLKSASSPRDLVDIKWCNSLHGRMTVLHEEDHNSYLCMFPALRCPWGYELLAADFNSIYSEAKGKFAEKFPIVKGRLLLIKKIQACIGRDRHLRLR